MDDSLYPMIFKRKSFHLFKDTRPIPPEQLREIEEKYKTFTPLISDIRTAVRIVPGKETSCKRGEEYCILLYSEKKENYLANIGYIGEQLDLYLAGLNIGSLWFGIGKVNQDQFEGLDFVIMIAIAGAAEGNFRKDMMKSKRKPLDEIWTGSTLENVSQTVRFAPSACNSQPWIVENDGRELKLYRYKKPGKRGIMPADKVTFYNRIDIGIFMLFLDLCLAHENKKAERILYPDPGGDCEKTLVAAYRIGL